MKITPALHKLECFSGWHLQFGIFRLGSVAWEMSFGIFRLETFVYDPSLGNFRLDSSLENLRLNSFAVNIGVKQGLKEEMCHQTSPMNITFVKHIWRGHPNLVAYHNVVCGHQTQT